MLGGVAQVTLARGRNPASKLAVVITIALVCGSARHAGAQALPAPAVNAPGAAAPQPESPKPQPESAPQDQAAPSPAEEEPASGRAGLGAEEAPAPADASAAPNSSFAATQKQLAEVRFEREHRTNFWPWLAVGVGFGATLVSAGAGAAKALSCDHQCATPNWVALAVVVGAGIGTLSTIWLLRTDAALARIDSRRYQLEQELDREKFARLRRERSVAQAAPWFAVHLDF
jgi:hypothetical protein